MPAARVAAERAVVVQPSNQRLLLVDMGMLVAMLLVVAVEVRLPGITAEIFTSALRLTTPILRAGLWMIFTKALEHPVTAAA